MPVVGRQISFAAGIHLGEFFVEPCLLVLGREPAEHGGAHAAGRRHPGLGKRLEFILRDAPVVIRISCLEARHASVAGTVLRERHVTQSRSDHAQDER